MKDMLNKVCLNAIKYMAEHDDYSSLVFLPKPEIEHFKTRPLEEQAEVLAKNIASWIKLEYQREKAEKFLDMMQDEELKGKMQS